MTDTAKATDLLRLQVNCGDRFVAAAASAVAGVARALDFSDADADRVRSTVDALCREVATAHFDDARAASFAVIVRERRGALVVRIEDQGLPYPIDHFSLDDRSLPGRAHSRGDADSVRFESRGTEGNAVELSLQPSPDHQAHLADQPDVGMVPVDANAPIEVRVLDAADAPGVARCAYRCYGYTYANDIIYYPQQVMSLVERNLLRSVVGVTPSGEVVGHCGVIREHADSRVAETGMGIVDPRYRQHHLFETLKARLVPVVRELGLVGTYADAVTVHAITQKALALSGASETGILLGEIPAFSVFRGFEQEPPQRGSVVMYYQGVQQMPSRTLFAPRRYRRLLESIYQSLALPRIFRDPSLDDAPKVGSIHVEVRARRGLARIEVDAAGQDLLQDVAGYLRELCLHRLEVIHLDLPLCDAAAMAVVDDFAKMRFFFGAVIPELRDGDILRLQYLNNVELDPNRLVLYRDETRLLLQAILADQS